MAVEVNIQDNSAFIAHTFHHALHVVNRGVQICISANVSAQTAESNVDKFDSEYCGRMAHVHKLTLVGVLPFSIQISAGQSSAIVSDDDCRFLNFVSYIL